METTELKIDYNAIYNSNNFLQENQPKIVLEANRILSSLSDVERYHYNICCAKLFVIRNKSSEYSKPQNYTAFETLIELELINKYNHPYGVLPFCISNVFLSFLRRNDTDIISVWGTKNLIEKVITFTKEDLNHLPADYVINEAKKCMYCLPLIEDDNKSGISWLSEQVWHTLSNDDQKKFLVRNDKLIQQRDTIPLSFVDWIVSHDLSYSNYDYLLDRLVRINGAMYVYFFTSVFKDHKLLRPSLFHFMICKLIQNAHGKILPEILSEVCEKYSLSELNTVSRMYKYDDKLIDVLYDAIPKMQH